MEVVVQLSPPRHPPAEKKVDKESNREQTSEKTPSDVNWMSSFHTKYGHYSQKHQDC